MRMRVVKSVLGVALATALGVTVAVQGTSAQGGQAAPTQGGQAAAAQGGQAAPAQGAQGGGRGGGRGFNLPPLLMETDAFADGGIVPPKYAGRGGVQPGFKFSGAPAG